MKGGRGNLSRLLRRASALMAQEPYVRFFSGWPGPWEYADDVTTTERLRAAGFVGVRTSLEPAPVVLTSAEEYQRFITSVIFREHLARVPDDKLRSRFASALTVQASRDDPPFELDYRRLNLRGRRPARMGPEAPAWAGDRA